MEDGTTILFGLLGVAVDQVSVDATGARTVHVRTGDPAAAACPARGVFSTSVRQHRTTTQKDLPCGEAPLVVRWRKARSGAGRPGARARRSPSGSPSWRRARG